MADHPLADRLDRFRKLADEARRDAKRAPNAETRLAYEDLARSWDQLINEIVAGMESGKR